MLAGLPVPADAVQQLAGIVRDSGGGALADRLQRRSDTRGGFSSTAGTPDPLAQAESL
jgi:hypothetical protein